MLTKEFCPGYTSDRSVTGTVVRSVERLENGLPTPSG